MITEELDGAEQYINCAIKYKDNMPDLARVFATISNQEMEHVRMLHDAVTEIIEKYRQENGEPPAPMMAVYDYIHGKHIDKAAKIKTMQFMFKS